MYIYMNHVSIKVKIKYKSMHRQNALWTFRFMFNHVAFIFVQLRLDNAWGGFSGVDVDKYVSVHINKKGCLHISYMCCFKFRVDFTKYPIFHEVEFHEAKMESGDCLFIPFKWYVLSVKQIHCSVYEVHRLGWLTSTTSQTLVLG